METTLNEVTEAVATAAADMAAKLGLTQRKLEWGALYEGELVMVATNKGINIGLLVPEYGMVANFGGTNYRYERFRINGVEILEKRYYATETGWDYMPTVTEKLEDAVFYWTY